MVSNTTYEDWMNKIPGSSSISKIAIPGTHNSAAHFKISAPGIRCQGSTLRDQLCNGVRFLDLALSKDYMSRGSLVDDLIIVHGKFPVKLSGSYKFKHALSVLYDFLDNHPSETILLSIKQEGALLNWDHEKDEFARVLFQRFIGRHREKWYLSANIPTLNQCRGKLVLLRRFPVNENGVYHQFGIPSIWNYNDGVYENGTCCVQDFSSVKSKTDLDAKVDLIKIMFNKSKEYFEVHDTPKLFINFCSCSNIFNKSWWPSNVDKKIRQINIHKLYTSLSGIVVFDFAEREHWKLVHRLVDANFD